MPIPANAIVSVQPNVLSAGGRGLDIIALFLTESIYVPIGTIKEFSNALDVSAFFGEGSPEGLAGGFYFSGFQNSSIKPGRALFAQFNPNDVPAYLRGATLSDKDITFIQGLTGTLDVPIDGFEWITNSFSLSGATSFSNAAALIATAFAAHPPTAVAATGSMGAAVTAFCGAAADVTLVSGRQITLDTVVGFIDQGDQFVLTDPATLQIHVYSIVQQLSGTPGSDGIYQLDHSINFVIPSNAITINSRNVHVTALSHGAVENGAALTGTGVWSQTFVDSQLSGTPGGVGIYLTETTGDGNNTPNRQHFASTAVTVTYDILTVSAVSAGMFAVGQGIAGTGIPSGTYLKKFLTGTGTTGTYKLSDVASTTSEAITATPAAPIVIWDPIQSAFQITSPTLGANSFMDFPNKTSNDLAGNLRLSETKGAIISEGADAQGLSTFMDSIVRQTTDWAVFMTIFEPDGHGVSSAQKLKLSAWTSGQNNRYAYVAWDPQDTVFSNPADSFGGKVKALGYSGTCPIYVNSGINSPNGPNTAAFICGAAASIDFNELNGRISFAFKTQSGVPVAVENQTDGDTLKDNGYNFVGRYATANDEFIWFYPGQISGPFLWLDSYVNEIWLNNALQLALMNLLNNVKSIPYNNAGYGLIHAACLDPINAGLNFGAIRPGITLSNEQAAAIDNAAGAKISNTVSSRGYVLLVGDASPEVRQNRGSPPCTLWYCDGQSVQQINLASVAVL